MNLEQICLGEKMSSEHQGRSGVLFAYFGWQDKQMVPEAF